MGEERILIVGAGLAGLALAIALEQHGRPVDVVERAPSWTPGGAGLYLIGAATRALRELGADPGSSGKACVIRSQTLRNQRGERIAEFDTETFWAHCGPCLGMLRADLHRLLVTQLSSSRVRLGLAVQALRQGDDHAAVRFSDGTTETYDFVVGADGIRSTVRQHLVGQTPPRFRGQVGWRFVTRCPGGIDGWTAYLGRGAAFLILPVGEGRAYCYADRAAAQPFDDPPEGRVARLQQLFQDFAPPVLEALAAVEPAHPVHFAAIDEVAPPLYGADRVALIGDAAHAMSPNMACGAAMAFEDALVLAELVARAGVGPHLVAELVRRREPRVAWVRVQTDRRDRARGMAPLLRDTVMHLFWGRLYRANYQPLLARP